MSASSRTTHGAGRRRSRLARLMAAVALVSLTATDAFAVEDGPPAPTPVFAIRVGGEGLVPADGIGPAVGLTAGIRVHRRASILMDATVAALLGDVAHWSLLWGVRLNPVLERDLRLDLDIRAGWGRNGPLAQGRFIADGVEQWNYPIGRVEATLLWALGDRGGMGPRLRYEIQPVFVREIGHLPDGGEEVTDRLRFRGHQILLALAFEADAVEGIGHVGWDFGGGVGIAGDGEEAGAMLLTTFTWILDSRPARFRPTE